jgi:hypothetical protein
MSAAPVNLLQFAWLAFALLFGGLQITASILLLRERGIGPWLMLIGAVISVGGHVASQVFVVFFLNSGRLGIGSRGQILSVISGFSALGSLLFVGGLLLFALTRRSLAQRIAELESILQSRPQS